MEGCERSSTHGVDVNIGQYIPWQWQWRQIAIRLMYSFTEEQAIRGHFTEMLIFISYVYLTFGRTTSWRVCMVNFAQLTNIIGCLLSAPLSSFRKEIENLRFVKEVNNMISLYYMDYAAIKFEQNSLVCYLEYCRMFHIINSTKRKNGKENGE